MLPGAGRLDDPRSACVRNFIGCAPNDVVLVGAAARTPDDVVFLRRRAPDNIRTIVATAGSTPDDVVFRAGTPDDIITRAVRAPGAPDDVVFVQRRALDRRRAVVVSRADAAPHNPVAVAGARGPPRPLEPPRVGVGPKHAAAD